MGSGGSFSGSSFMGLTPQKALKYGGMLAAGPMAGSALLALDQATSDPSGKPKDALGINKLSKPADLTAPDFTDSIIQSVAANERMRAKGGRTRGSFFSNPSQSAAEPVKFERPPPPTKK